MVPHGWPSGDGEMAQRIRAHDWAATPLGPIETWPFSLKLTVDLTLSSPVPTILLWGPVDMQIYNDRWRDVMSTKHPGALGQPTHECFPEIAHTMAPLYERVRRGEGVVLQDMLLPVVRRGEQHDAWWNVNCLPVRDERGAVAGILCTVVESTAIVLAELERVAATTALRESEERQVFLLKLSDAMRPLTDPVEIQRAAMKLLAEHFDVMRASYFEVEADQDAFTLTARYERNAAPIPNRMRLSDFAPEMAAAYRAGRTLVFRDTETDLQLGSQPAAYRPLGIRAWAAVPLVKSGRLLAIVGMHARTPRDWTGIDVKLLEDVADRTWAAVERARAEAALRESEEKYRSLFERIDEGFCIIEMIFDGPTPVDYRFVEVNPAFEHHTGIVNAQGRLMRDIAPHHEQHWFDYYGEIAVSGQGMRFEAPAKALGDRWYDLNAFPVGEPSQRRVAMVFSDITQRQRDAAILRESEERLRTAVTERDELLKELHHRVKNNLQVVTSLLEMQGRQAADPEAASLLSDARDRITAIAAIHELLYQSGSFSEVDLSAYARRLVRHVVSLYGRNGHIDASVVGDDIRIDLARAVPFGLLLNELVSNACKHAFPSKTEGALRVALHQEDGTIRLEVADNGVGLPSGFSDRVPETLGVQLVRMLAKQLGGNVTFECAGETSVEFRMPMQGRAG